MLTMMFTIIVKQVEASVSADIWSYTGPIKKVWPAAGTRGKVFRICPCVMNICTKCHDVWSNSWNKVVMLLVWLKSLKSDEKQDKLQTLQTNKSQDNPSKRYLTEAGDYFLLSMNLHHRFSNFSHPVPPQKTFGSPSTTVKMQQRKADSSVRRQVYS